MRSWTRVLVVLAVFTLLIGPLTTPASAVDRPLVTGEGRGPGRVVHQLADGGQLIIEAYGGRTALRGPGSPRPLLAGDNWAVVDQTRTNSGGVTVWLFRMVVNYGYDGYAVTFYNPSVSTQTNSGYWVMSQGADAPYWVSYPTAQRGRGYAQIACCWGFQYGVDNPQTWITAYGSGSWTYTYSCC